MCQIMQLAKLMQKKYERKLIIELRPKTVQSSTLFQRYSKTCRLEKWATIKEELVKREGNICFICGKKSSHLHLHEFWNYDDNARIMRLHNIHQICTLCQKLKRTDFWFFTDYGKEQLKKLDIGWEELIRHYCKVNKCSIKDFGENWKEAIEVWKERSKFNWNQDFGEYLP